MSGWARRRAHAIEAARSVPLRGQQSQQWRITGPDLQRWIRIGQHKAKGADMSATKHWIDMPDYFFNMLAEVWNLALDTGKLPEAWTQVRVVTFQTTGGGFRGLGIATAAWRAGMLVLMERAAS